MREALIIGGSGAIGAAISESLEVLGFRQTLLARDAERLIHVIEDRGSLAKPLIADMMTEKGFPFPRHATAKQAILIRNYIIYQPT